VNQQALFIEDLTAEEKTERRLQKIESTDYGLSRALSVAGVRTIYRAGGYIALVDQCLCREPLRMDSEHPDLDRPRIRRRDVFCPLHNTTLAVRAVLDPFMKTPSKKQAFLKKLLPADPQGDDFFAVEAGAEHERHALDADLHTALDKANAWPDEPLQACIIRCRDKARAVEIAKEQRDSLPWAEDLQLRPDGSLLADWHGGRLTAEEQRLLKRQQVEDLKAKRERRAAMIREMQRVPL
jgi:hypothetical protein